MPRAVAEWALPFLFWLISFFSASLRLGTARTVTKSRCRRYCCEPSSITNGVLEPSLLRGVYSESMMATQPLAPAESHPEGRPTIPDRVEDLGIPRSLVNDLVLRYLWLHGSATLAKLHETLKLSFPILETLFHQFRQQQLLEVKGMLGNDYSFSLTGGGRHSSHRAERSLPVCGTDAGFDSALPRRGKDPGRACQVEPRKPEEGL